MLLSVLDLFHSVRNSSLSKFDAPVFVYHTLNCRKLIIPSLKLGSQSDLAVSSSTCFFSGFLELYMVTCIETSSLRFVA